MTRNKEDCAALYEEQWFAQVKQMLRQRGVDSIVAFAKRHPGKSLSELASELGGIAPVLVQKCYEDEARSAKDPRECIEDLLIRRLLELGLGWPQGSQWEDQNAARYQLLEWSGCLKGTLYEAAMRDMVMSFLAEKDIPAGWRPAATNDPLIAARFKKYWPE